MKTLLGVIGVVFLLVIVGVLLYLLFKGVREMISHFKHPKKVEPLSVESRQAIDNVGSSVKTFLKNLTIGFAAIVVIVAIFHKEKVDQSKQFFSFQKIYLGMSLSQLESLNICDILEKSKSEKQIYNCYVASNPFTKATSDSLPITMVFDRDKLIRLEILISITDASDIVKFISQDIGEPTSWNVAKGKDLESAESNQDIGTAFWASRKIKLAVKKHGIGTIKMGSSPNEDTIKSDN